MKVAVFNHKGEIIEELPLKKEIEKEEFNPNFLHLVYKKLLSNRYPLLAFTKTRKEVKGGGKKPWPQKGTGRARHGSIRSPLWKGGGVVFGPRRKEENLKKKVNKKEKKKALRMALLKKIEGEEMRVIDTFNLEEIKTKKYDEILKNILKPKKRKMPSVLVVLDSEKEKELKRGLRNLPYLNILTLQNLDLIEILNRKYLILSKETFLKLENLLI